MWNKIFISHGPLTKQSLGLLLRIMSCMFGDCFVFRLLFVLVSFIYFVVSNIKKQSSACLVLCGIISRYWTTKFMLFQRHSVKCIVQFWIFRLASNNSWISILQCKYSQNTETILTAMTRHISYEVLINCWISFLMIFSINHFVQPQFFTLRFTLRFTCFIFQFQYHWCNLPKFWKKKSHYSICWLDLIVRFSDISLSVFIPF